VQQRPAATVPGNFDVLLMMIMMIMMMMMMMMMTDTDTNTLLKFKQQTCMNRPIQLTIQ